MLQRLARFRTSLISVSAIGLVLASMAWAPTANAVSYHQIKNHNGQCLEITDGSSSNGADAQQYTCNSNSKQYWALSSVVAPNGSDALLIINEKSGKCLSVLNNNTSPGAAVIQYTCNNSGGDFWEDWVQDCSTGIANYCKWVSLGDAGGPEGPDGCCVMHPSGDGSSPGLNIYVNISPEGANAYLWTHTAI